MVRARKSATSAPQLDELRLTGLADGDPADLTSDADLESVCFTDVVRPSLSLQHGRVMSCRFSGLAAEEADLRNARLAEVDLDQVSLPVVRAARGQWRDVRVSGRLGSVEAYEANWRSVHFVGCKLSFVNLRGAELIDVGFTDCVIEELDLLDATLRRVRLADTRVANLNVRGGDFQDFDLRGASFDSVDDVMSLRGATLTPEQLALMAPLLAAGLGLRVES
jgi:uncharacterized protein YjbI with pentapeptide repeats